MGFGLTLSRGPRGHNNLVLWLVLQLYLIIASFDHWLIIVWCIMCGFLVSFGSRLNLTRPAAIGHLVLAPLGVLVSSWCCLGYLGYVQMFLYTISELRYYVDIRVAVLRLLAQHLHCDKQVPIPIPNLDWRTDASSSRKLQF